MVFTLKEMEEATNMFSDRNLIGKGGFGRVYRGVLKDGQVLCFSPIPVDFLPVGAGSFFQNLLTHAKLFAAQTLMSILSFSSFHLKHFELLQVLAALIQFEERFSFFFFC